MLRAPGLHDVHHGFTGRGEGDLRRTELAAQASLVAKLGGAGPLRTAYQVHGARVVWTHEIADDGPEAGTIEADAILSATSGQVVAVRVADCVPVLLAGPGVVGAVHAGWRGTAADIVRAAVRELCRGSRCAPNQLRAAVGPSIRGCCYEVGEEVVAAVAAVTPGRSWLVGRNVDLAEANRAILAELGVAVEAVGGCTRCEEGWYSHRRGDVERQVGAIRA